MVDVVYFYPRIPGRVGSYPQEMEPIGLAYLAAFLEAHGYSGRIVDLNVEDVDVRTVIEKENPLATGISGTTPSRFESFRIAREVKEANPLVKTVYGGPHASFTTQDILAHIPEVDVVVIGEGEQTLLELVQAFKEGNSDLSDVLGIAYRRKDGQIYQTPPRPRIVDLDELPFPARHLVQMDKYRLRMEFLDENIRGAQIITSRGCPYSCSFCSASVLWSRSYRKRSAENVISEIKLLVDRYNAQGLKFFDSTFTIDRSHVLAICAGLQREGLSSIPWECEIRADTVDRELLRSMKEAGCYYIDVGLESASSRILKGIDKRITVDQVAKVLEWAYDLGLYTKVFITFGHPGETVNDVKKTLAFTNEWQDKITKMEPNPIIIYPGTGVEQYAQQQGYLPEGFSWSEPHYEETNKTLTVSPYDVVLYQDQLGYSELLRIHNYQRIQKYATNPVNIVKKLMEISSMEDIRSYWNSIRDYLMFRQS